MINALKIFRSKKQRSRNYGISAHCYLERAKKQLGQGKREALFYAAFELRCGIESRMQQYLEVRHDLSKKRKSGWQIAKLGKDLDHAFKVNNKVIEVVFKDGNKERRLFYFPVTKSLRKKAEKIGDLMHAMQKLKVDNDLWWVESRRFLKETFDELKKACAGNLLGPPLMKKSNGNLNMYVELNKETEHWFPDFNKIGKEFIADINYLDP